MTKTWVTGEAVNRLLREAGYDPANWWHLPWETVDADVNVSGYQAHGYADRRLPLAAGFLLVQETYGGKGATDSVRCYHVTGEETDA